MTYKNALLPSLLVLTSALLLACPDDDKGKEGSDCWEEGDCDGDLFCLQASPDTEGECVKEVESCDENTCWDSYGDCTLSGAAVECDLQIDIGRCEIDDAGDQIAIAVYTGAPIIEVSPPQEIEWVVAIEDESGVGSCTATVINVGGGEFECTMQVDDGASARSRVTTDIVPDGTNNVCEPSADGTHWRFEFSKDDCGIEVGSVSLRSASDADGGSTDAFEGTLESGPPPSTGTEKPVLLHPCDVFTTAAIEAYTGMPMTVYSNSGADTNRRICEFRPAGDVGGVRLRVEAQLNSSADGFFTQWKSQRAAATTIETVSWSPEGEFRITEGAASIWAFVVNTDYLGRDIFVWVESMPYAGGDGMGTPAPIGTLESTCKGVSEDLNDAILAAQP